MAFRHWRLWRFLLRTASRTVSLGRGVHDKVCRPDHWFWRALPRCAVPPWRGSTFHNLVDSVQSRDVVLVLHEEHEITSGLDRQRLGRKSMLFVQRSRKGLTNAPPLLAPRVTKTAA